MITDEILTKMQAEAEYVCGHQLCSTRYCDDEVHKADRYRKDVPALVAEVRRLRAENASLSENLAISNARAVELEAALRILQRYHWGDGTITREQVIEALSGVKGSDDE